MPLRISVITINRNTGAAAQRTADSVLMQSIPVEWVVVDGASDDGSGEILRSAQRPGDVFISEPDRGIADAFNKGLKRATGDAVLFMNAGDEFASPTCLADLITVWDRNAHRWIVGAGDLLDKHGKVLFRRGYKHTPPDPLSLVRWNCRIMHQAVLAERSLFNELHGFDDSFRIAMDYELWIRWLTRGYIPQMNNLVVCRFHRGGISGDPMRNHRENRRARAIHGLDNGAIGEAALAALAWTKARIGGRYGRWMYRLKERLGIRI